MEYSKVLKLANEIQKDIPGLYITGSLKRKAPIVNDIDFLTMNNLNDILDKLKEITDLDILAKGEKHLSVHLNDFDIQADFWKANNRYELFYKRFLRDIDKGHSIYYKKQAIKYGYKLTENGLYKKDEKVNIHNKKDLLNLLK